MVRRSRANRKYMPTSIFSGHKNYCHRRQSVDQAVDKIHMLLLQNSLRRYFIEKVSITENIEFSVK